MTVELTIAEAVKLVRKNLDELEPNGSSMYGGEDADNASLDAIIGRNLPEAINSVVLLAPVGYLEGHTLTPGELAQTLIPNPVQDGVLEFTPPAADFLRLVAFKAWDSQIVVTNYLDEASAEGRKQLNRYLRGRPDRPRLVKVQGTTTPPVFRYYSLERIPQAGQETQAISLFTYAKEAKLEEGGTPVTHYDVPRLIKRNIIDMLTGLVLQAFNDQRSSVYITKANIW